jgi:undecaprenyl-diphosphatase
MYPFFVIFVLLALTFFFPHEWDIQLLKSINLGRIQSLDKFFKTITDSAAPVTYSLPIIIMVFALVKKNKIMIQKNYYIFASIITSGVLATIIKHTVNRPRPSVTYHFLQKLTGSGNPSFPSGHTCDAFVLATAISLFFPHWKVVLPLYIWALMVGFSRMDLGVHYPSDVLAGVFIGSGSAIVCYQVKLFFDKRTKKNSIHGSSNHV